MSTSDTNLAQMEELPDLTQERDWMQEFLEAAKLLEAAVAGLVLAGQAPEREEKIAAAREKGRVYRVERTMPDLPKAPDKVELPRVALAEQRQASQATLTSGKFADPIAGDSNAANAQLRAALDAYSRLERGSSEAEAKLSGILTSAGAWLANCPDRASPEALLIQELHGVAMQERIECALVAKAARSAVLAPEALTDAFGEDSSPAAEAAKALSAARAEAPNSRDSKNKLFALLAHVKDLEPRHPALEAALEAEIAELQAVWDRVDAMRRKDPDFETTGVWSEEGSAIKFQSGKNCVQDGQPKPSGRLDTAEAQIGKFLDRLEIEIGRSAIYAEMIRTVGESTHPDPIPMSLAKYSAAFGDSAATGAVDIDHLDAFPEDPHQHGEGCGHDHGEGFAGIAKGELMLHFIEERIYMQSNGGSYDLAHNACLGANSLQNRYREERGQDSFSFEFDCRFHDASQEVADFRGADSSGNVTIVRDIDNLAPDDPYHDHVPLKPAEIEVHDMTELAESKLKAVWQGCLNLIKDRVEFGVIREEFNALKRWTLMRYNGDQGDYDAAMAQFERTYNERLAAFDSKNTDASHVEENVALRDLQTEHANAFLAIPGQPGGSRVLQKLRSERKPTGVNDAGTNGAASDTHLNCAVCTLAAMGPPGATSTSTVAGFLERHTNLDDAQAADAAGRVQSHEMFYRAEMGHMLPEGDPAKMLEFGSDGMPKSDRAPVVGDAQFRGVRTMLDDVVTRRNADQEIVGEMGRVKAVQDGVPEEGGLHDIEDMKARMGAYPDGTQFQVFMVADGMQHWVYAEVYNGQLVMEDYQVAEDSSSDTAKPAAGYLGEAPQHPVTAGQDVFHSGCFIAITPEDFDPGASAATLPLEHEDWPPFGSDEKQGLDEIVKAILAGGDLTSSPDALVKALGTVKEAYSKICAPYLTAAVLIQSELEKLAACVTAAEADGVELDVMKGLAKRGWDAVGAVRLAGDSVPNGAVRRLLDDRLSPKIQKIAAGLSETRDGQEYAAVKARVLRETNLEKRWNMVRDNAGLVDTVDPPVKVKLTLSILAEISALEPVEDQNFAECTRAAIRCANMDEFDHANTLQLRDWRDGFTGAKRTAYLKRISEQQAVMGSLTNGPDLEATASALAEFYGEDAAVVRDAFAKRDGFQVAATQVVQAFLTAAGDAWKTDDAEKIKQQGKVHAVKGDVMKLETEVTQGLQKFKSAEAQKLRDKLLPFVSARPASQKQGIIDLIPSELQPAGGPPPPPPP